MMESSYTGGSEIEQVSQLDVIPRDPFRTLKMCMLSAVRSFVCTFSLHLPSFFRAVQSRSQPASVHGHLLNLFLLPVEQVRVPLSPYFFFYSFFPLTRLPSLTHTHIHSSLSPSLTQQFSFSNDNARQTLEKTEQSHGLISFINTVQAHGYIATPA